MASGDQRAAVVRDSPDQPAGLTRHRLAQPRREFFWVQGPAGSVSFTLDPGAPGLVAGALSLPEIPGWGDCGYHSFTPRQGWSETAACDFLGEADGWCAWNSGAGAELLQVYTLSGEEALYSALAGIYQAVFGRVPGVRRGCVHGALDLLARAVGRR